MVTPDWVDQKLLEIESAKDDPEIAHGMEDDLFVAVLEAISTGKCVDNMTCARKALLSRKIGFARWYA